MRVIKNDQIKCIDTHATIGQVCRERGAYCRRHYDELLFFDNVSNNLIGMLPIADVASASGICADYDWSPYQDCFVLDFLCYKLNFEENETT